MATTKRIRPRFRKKKRIFTTDYNNQSTTPKPTITNQCKGCGYHIAAGETYCGECLCEDDCGY